MTCTNVYHSCICNHINTLLSHDIVTSHRLYSVIHMSVKHFKNSQHIIYSTDHGSSYADRERSSPSFFYIFHRCSMCPPSVIRQISMTVHLVPHACQHIMVDQNHSSGDTVAKIWRLSCSGGTKTASFTNPQKKKSHVVKSGDRGGHRINASSSFPVRPIHLCGKSRIEIPSHVFVVSRRAVSLKGVIIDVVNNKFGLHCSY